jgi:hypothetical protein
MALLPVRRTTPSLTHPNSDLLLRLRCLMCRCETTTYQFHPPPGSAEQRVYQYHMDTSQGVGRVTEEHVLGLYDAKATAAAAKRDAVAAVTDAGRAWQAHQEQLLKDSSATKDNAADQATDAAGAAAVAGDSAADSKAPDSKAAAAGPAAGAADGSSSKAAAAPAAAAAAAPPPPMLELLDYLPDTAAMLQSHWPYIRQMYTGEHGLCRPYFY